MQYHNYSAIAYSDTSIYYCIEPWLYYFLLKRTDRHAIYYTHTICMVRGLLPYMHIPEYDYSRLFLFTLLSKHEPQYHGSADQYLLQSEIVYHVANFLL